MKASELKKMMEDSVRKVLLEILPDLYTNEVLPVIDSIIDKRIKSLKEVKSINRPNITYESVPHIDEYDSIPMKETNYKVADKNKIVNYNKNNILDVINNTRLSSTDLSGMRDEKSNQ